MALTPNLDEMARGAHSIRFDRFYSSAPVCSPTRGSLLTGRNHNRFCVWRANTAGRACRDHSDFLCHAKNPLPLSERTVAEVLQEHGYRTAAIGKWHLGDLKPAPGLERLASNPGQNGFDFWKVTERAVPTSTPNCGCFNDTSLCNRGHYGDQVPSSCTNYHQPASDSDGSSGLMAHPEPILRDDSDFIADQFSEFLEETFRDGTKQPFFAYIPFHSVHKNFIATPPYDALYDPERLSQEEIDYYGSISSMDNAVGRIRALLQHHGVGNNTMIWFASDNGPALKSPGSTGGLRGRKGSLYEGGIRVPGIVEWPDRIGGNRISTYPVTTSDFAPTVLDLLGVGAENRTLDGISILPLLREGRGEGRGEGGSAEEGPSHPAGMAGYPHTRNSTIKWAFNIKGNFDGHYTAVIMDNQYKLMASYRRGKVESYSLYNVEEDPAESRGLLEENSALASSLVRMLDRWMVSVRHSATQEVGCLLEQ